MKLMREGDAFLLPSQAGNLESTVDALSDISAKLDKIPFSQIGMNLNKLLQTADHTLGSSQTKQVIASLGETLETTNTTVAMLNQSYGGDSDFQVNLEQLMDQGSAALSSIVKLSDYLDNKGFPAAAFCLWLSPVIDGHHGRRLWAEINIRCRDAVSGAAIFLTGASPREAFAGRRDVGRLRTATRIMCHVPIVSLAVDDGRWLRCAVIESNIFTLGHASFRRRRPTTNWQFHGSLENWRPAP